MKDFLRQNQEMFFGFSSHHRSTKPNRDPMILFEETAMHISTSKWEQRLHRQMASGSVRICPPRSRTDRLSFFSFCRRTLGNKHPVHLHRIVCFVVSRPTCDCWVVQAVKYHSVFGLDYAQILHSLTTKKNSGCKTIHDNTGKRTKYHCLKAW